MNTKQATTISTWLPCFPGFYNTLFEPQFDSELDYLKREADDPLADDVDEGDLLCGWDNRGYERAVIGCICDRLPGYFPRESGILKCSVQRVVNPKEYNFANDSADVGIEIDMAMFAPWLRAYLGSHAQQWEQHIKRHYTSYDGFCSFYSSFVGDWNEAVEHMLNGTEPKDRNNFYSRRFIGQDHLLGRVLEFVLETERAKKTDEPMYVRMYYDVCDRVYVGEFIDLEKVKAHLEQ